jgi:hypothetical protein
MKCPCGYEGIPTASDFDSPTERGWKCPACHVSLAKPYRHDPVLDDAEQDWVCSLCGMRGPTPADLHTECPGHAAHWHMRTLNCACGEWHPPPPGKPRRITCRRCKARFPHYLPDLGD